MAATIPIMPIDSGTPRSISPTDVSQFIRLDQCQRYLRLRLLERADGQAFLKDMDVAPQSIPPILTRSGARFEVTVADDLAQRVSVTAFSADQRAEQATSNDNHAVTRIAANLPAGQTTVLLQPRIEAAIGEWRLRGDIDLMHVFRTDEGRLQILLADMKSSTAVKVEHRLQVAFYHEMLTGVLQQAGLDHDVIELAILYRGSLAVTDVDDVLRRDREQALSILGTDAGYLELITDREAYLGAVHDLVLGKQSVANRLLQTPFAEIPFHLTYKCDGCLYNEFCLKRAAEDDDLSLLPHLTDGDKNALRTRGVTTTQELADLKTIRRDGNTSIDGVQQAAISLVPTLGRELLARDLATTWPVGRRMDELVHRAKRYRWFKDRTTDSVPWIPDKGYSTLPASDASLHPNLVRVYVDVQHDYLQDRVYLLGALVVGSEHGVEQAARRRSVVRMATAPPESDEIEAALLSEWLGEVLQAIVDVAAPNSEGESKAPVHLVFFDGFAQRALLDACGRHAQQIFGATALYDFVTQLAAYDSPVATILDTQIREQKNYPMLCQSLQSVATFLKFDWNQDVPYRTLFNSHMFDYIGKLDDGTGNGEWFTRRSRFNSQIPLEYAYAAWDALPHPASGKADEFANYRTVSPDLVRGFHARRLEAIEHVTRDFRGNRQTTLSSFVLPDLSLFSDVAPSLAHALDEFVTIERHVELASWKSDRYATPEQRMLRGQALVVQYREEDQEPEQVEINRENLRRFRLAEQMKAARADGKLSKAEREVTKWGHKGQRYRLRLEVADDAADLDDVLRLVNFKAGDVLLLAPRLTVDSRQPVSQQVLYTPTAKQLFSSPRVRLVSIETDRHDSRTMRAWALVEMDGGGFGNMHMGAYAFGGYDRPLIPEETYSLDDDPNDINGYWAHKVTEGLLTSGDQNRLYQLLTQQPWPDVPMPPAFVDGQERFQAGLEALYVAGAMHDFEQSKRQFIGDHATAPVLLVQGPPGTGKSYSTAFAVLARLQGAMAAGIDYRVMISCKTHAAVDVLLTNVREAMDELAAQRARNPEIFATWFDDRLFDIPLFRNRPRGLVESPIVPLPKDGERLKGSPKAVERILGERWAVVASTPGGIYGLVRDHWDAKSLFGHELVQCLVLDEASQMDLPNAIMAALPLSMTGHLIVVGDHRQMPPIIKNDWTAEPRRTFKAFKAYESLFLTLKAMNPAMVQFAESFRLHADMAEFLRKQIYAQDGIDYHSKRRDVIGEVSTGDSFIRAVLTPQHPLVVIVHDEESSQLQNQFELELMAPILGELADREGLALDPMTGLGVVVPHRSQRAAITEQVRVVSIWNEETGVVEISAVDTVERFQGDERTVVLYGATESDRDYLLKSSKFLMDPRRLTVALSRAKRKLIVVASRSVFDLFSADEETFVNAQLWKNLLRQTCTELLWEGERHGQQVQVWGNPTTQPSETAPLGSSGI